MRTSVAEFRRRTGTPTPHIYVVNALVKLLARTLHDLQARVRLHHLPDAGAGRVV
ncbi:MAG: hypothetical protein ABI633_00660 [Burkholderiales bacterium]